MRASNKTHSCTSENMQLKKNPQTQYCRFGARDKKTKPRLCSSAAVQSSMPDIHLSNHMQLSVMMFYHVFSIALNKSHQTEQVRKNIQLSQHLSIMRSNLANKPFHVKTCSLILSFWQITAATHQGTITCFGLFLQSVLPQNSRLINPCNQVQ